MTRASPDRRSARIWPRNPDEVGSTSAESSLLEGGGFDTREPGMTVRLERTAPFCFQNLHAITAVPFRSAFAWAEVMTPVLTRAPLAWATRPGTWRMAVPGLGPGLMS